MKINDEFDNKVRKLDTRWKEKIMEQQDRNFMILPRDLDSKQ